VKDRDAERDSGGATRLSRCAYFRAARCGALAAGCLLSGCQWVGPRERANVAGYLAQAPGFVVGILPFLPIRLTLKPHVQPADLYSFFAGFIVCWIGAKAGLEPRRIAMRTRQ